MSSDRRAAYEVAAGDVRHVGGQVATSSYFIASRFGDVLGTDLYDHFGGFTVCVIAITVVYALIPGRLIATADGQMPELGSAVD